MNSETANCQAFKMLRFII